MDQIVSFGLEQMAKLPDADMEQRRLLEKVLTFYLASLRERSTDPELRQVTGRTYQRIGDIYQRLQEPAKAIDANEKALAVQQTLRTLAPGKPLYLQDHAQTCDNLAGLYEQAGDPSRDRK